MVAGVKSKSKALEYILVEFFDKTPKSEYESKKKEVQLFAEFCYDEVEKYKNNFVRPTNAERKQKLLVVAECADALDAALKALAKDNYAHDMMLVKKYVDRYNSAHEVPLNFSPKEFFGSKNNSSKKVAAKLLSKFEQVKAHQESKILSVKFAYKNRGVHKFLRSLKKAAVKQERLIKVKKGGPKKSALAKMLFVELCGAYFQQNSTHPIRTTTGGKFRTFIMTMNRRIYDEENDMQKQVGAYVKSLKAEKAVTPAKLG